MKSIGVPFYTRLFIYIAILALSITSLAGNQWGEITQSKDGKKNRKFIGVKPQSIDVTSKKKIQPPEWQNTVFGLMIAGTAAQGVGLMLNLCDLSQPNDYFVLSGYAMAFVGSILIIAAASEWIDQSKTLVAETDFFTKAIGGLTGDSISAGSAWGAYLALASGIIGTTAAVSGLTITMHNRTTRPAGVFAEYGKWR